MHKLKKITELPPHGNTSPTTYTYTSVSGRIGVDFNGWFLARCCCLETIVIVKCSRLNWRVFVWSFGIFQFLLKIILSPKRVFFTEIPPRPRSRVFCKKNSAGKKLVYFQLMRWQIYCKSESNNEGLTELRLKMNLYNRNGKGNLSCWDWIQSGDWKLSPMLLCWQCCWSLWDQTKGARLARPLSWMLSQCHGSMHHRLFGINSLLNSDMILCHQTCNFKYILLIYILWIFPVILPNFITWFAVHCFSSVHWTQCIVQYNAL